MSKEKKSNKEVKKPKAVKPKAVSDETQPQRKSPKNHDGTISGLFDSSN